MKRVYEAYERSCCRAGCNPSLFLIAAIAILCALFYHYRSQVTHTMVITATLILIGVGVSAITFLVVTILRWNWKRPVPHPAEPLPEPEDHVAPEPVAAGPGRAQDPDIAAAADLIAGDDIGIQVSQDGSIIVTQD
jgi:hypothetical protein